ncbi:MAG: hypothetical protein PGN23_10095 [Sphingomonas adhaesiva]|uniref:hypothetical protein n=1 Tax=Sphingomonas adhaesiva TaxID=28212 RepID=UPI002FF94A4D
MATSRARRALLAGATALAAAAAAVAQERPESLLPPGFSDPAPAPSAAPRTPAPVATATATGGVPMVQPLPTPGGSPSPLPSPSASPSPMPTPRYEMPASARRSLARVGASDAFASDAFGAADGAYLETLMRRLSAPLPSRWLSIALRRMLVARVDTPAGVGGADFAAERAWLLLRMGEAADARAVVQAVDTDRITPKLRQVWMQAALATADPAGLCPLADAAGNSERGWIVARAMCAGLTGNARSQPLIADVRRRRVASGVDLQLAQKVMGAGLNSRQAITIEWAPVTELTAWRFGLATATGVSIPDELYATVGAQVAGWRALAPGIPLAERAVPAEAAAAMGVISSAALVDLYSALGDADDMPAPLTRTANALRDAYAANDARARLDAMQRLWDEAETPAARYARLVLTAHAAGRLPVVDGDARADRVIASMLTAGLDRTAMRWSGHVKEGGDAWAMLLLADPDAIGQRPGGVVGTYAPEGPLAERKRQLFFAGLAGLGRLSQGDMEERASSLDVRIGAENSWTRAIDRAARERQPGTVLLLAAVGMQSGRWSGIPPAALYRVVSGLRAVGLDGEARMIAAEAIARVG